MTTSEFGGKWDSKKTLPVQPRPVRRAKDKLRMGYITGDSKGNSPRDNGEAWRGERKPE